MSKIAWTDKTWNPVVGCTKVSEGCKNCYAEKMAYRLGCMGIPKYQDVTYGDGGWAGVINTLPDQLDKPLYWKKPRRIFVCSMGDLFLAPFEFIDKVFATIGRCPQHTFQILTKQSMIAKEYITGLANRLNGTQLVCMLNFENWPLSNVHLGVSVENQKRADERIPILLQIPGIKFLSLEPLLGPMDIRLIEGYTIKTVRVEDGKTPCYRNLDTAGHLNHIIIGAESIGGAAGRECKLEWIESLVEQAKAAGVPCGVKQIHVGGKLLKYNKKTSWPDAWPEHLKIWEI